MKALYWAVLIMSAAASVAGVVIQAFQWAGVEFDGAVAALSETSRVWLPVATFLLGMFAGYLLSRRNSEAGAGSPAPAAEAVPADASDPLAGLVPAEREFLLRVYDEAAVRVEEDGVQVARSLNAKGLVHRLGFEGDRRAVIQGCDVVLADGAARLLNARADELRGRA